MNSENITNIKNPPVHIRRKDYVDSQNGSYILEVKCPSCGDESITYIESSQYYGCGSVLNDCDFIFDINYYIAFKMVSILETKLKKKQY